MTENRDQTASVSYRPTHRRRHILLAIVIFVCGILIGIGLTSHFLWSRYAERQPSFPGMSGRMVHHMVEELKLNEDQAQAIEEIFQRWEVEIRLIRNDSHDRFETIIKQIEAELAEVLTEEQMTRWTGRTEKMKERWSKRGRHGEQKERRHRDKPPDGPPPNKPE